ncbi:YjeF [Exophiala aquamarina CBS 119918]|uniref:NAD(P)H-hydrate epimerase n=1 Tax=Exophiala aquamarina CBS 119918 TaxID=1182545 RepID=A0A072PXX5_9EURO|nr:YjeF [Exophiala aquamarina CBS 119918]KEF60450.1 YjeF [Exophiala aquamarina CBS 119918]
MSEEGGFSIDQLMELAGLSVAQAVYRVHPPSSGPMVLIAAGPGNNGGDGLVAARHLHHFGYTPTIYYPKPTNQPIFSGLQKQLHHLSIPLLTTPESFTSALQSSDLVVDALFGFSFHPPVRPPFDTVLRDIITARKPVLSVDIPSSWDVEAGPPSGDDQVGHDFMPEYLISLTAAKPSVRHFKGKRHFIGGRFLSAKVAEKYGLEVPEYNGVDQIAEVDVGVKVEKL